MRHRLWLAPCLLRAIWMLPSRQRPLTLRAIAACTTDTPLTALKSMSWMAPEATHWARHFRLPTRIGSNLRATMPPIHLLLPGIPYPLQLATPRVRTRRKLSSDFSLLPSQLLQRPRLLSPTIRSRLLAVPKSILTAR